MTLNKNNFLDKIKKATIHNEPFEHLVVDNLLPGDFYNKFPIGERRSPILYPVFKITNSKITR